MKLNELLGIKYPLIQGAMANIATAKFAATISNAGGLGILGAGAMYPADLEVALETIVTLTDQPFGVNLMLMNPHCEEMVPIITKYADHIKVVTTGAGNPGPFMSAFKEAGILVAPVVPSVALAKRVVKAGADFVIVEGTEAGGHVGELTTMALVPQIVEAIDVPVVAAGGIASGKQLLAAYALGAIGVQVGTCLLAAEECEIHDNYKQTLLKAKDTSTVVTGRSVGVPVRIYKNKMAREYTMLEKSGKTREELEHLTLGALRKAVFNGDMDNGSVMIGQVAGMINEIKPAKDILETLFNEAELEFEKLQQLLG
ncbi:MAG: nitronate monooxygenase family protein [Defluviitaleaceae bacterium]|nr:nitronate monooxygenase family protein [Defluviitaleaceae bacterium]